MAVKYFDGLAADGREVKIQAKNRKGTLRGEAPDISGVGRQQGIEGVSLQPGLEIID